MARPAWPPCKQGARVLAGRPVAGARARARPGGPRTAAAGGRPKVAALFGSAWPRTHERPRGSRRVLRARARRRLTQGSPAEGLAAGSACAGECWRRAPGIHALGARTLKGLERTLRGPLHQALGRGAGRRRGRLAAAPARAPGRSAAACACRSRCHLSSHSWGQAGEFRDAVFFSHVCARLASLRSTASRPQGLRWGWQPAASPCAPHVPGHSPLARAAHTTAGAWAPVAGTPTGSAASARMCCPRRACSSQPRSRRACRFSGIVRTPELEHAGPQGSRGHAS